MHDLQAARRTTLKRSAHRLDKAHRRRLLTLFGAVALVGYLLDILTKIQAVATLTGRPDVPLIGDWFTLHLVRNPGAAFGMGVQATVVLTSLAMAAVLAILWWCRRIGTAWWAVALGLLLAGIGGNLTDRLFRQPGPMRGHVVDFLRLPNWPVFNLADIFINVGAAMVVITLLRGVEIDGSRTPKDQERS